MPLIKSLNKEQKEAVLYTEGPLLIIAGAGSGKTRALTHRIAHLLKNKNISPFNILAVTFTNKAADEMKFRLKNLAGPASKNIWIGTFHSVCGRILRADIHKIGRGNNFVIYDGDDQKALMKQVLKELNLDIKQYRPSSILESISKAKNELINGDEYERRVSDFWQEKVAHCYKLYQKELLKNNALDFDDMLSQTVLLLKESPKTAGKYQERFQYMHIDEYQDTNHAQYMLSNILSAKNKNICVVGDDDQSIYSFRGADIRNILEFERDYPNAKVIKLEENYRSTKNILNAANCVVSNNFMRKDKKLWTENEDGKKIIYYNAENEKDEAGWIIKKILELKKEMDLTNIAVLYRTNAQSRTIEEACLKWGIPYKIVGGYRFYERKEIKDMIAILRLIYNPADNISCVRVMDFFADGIGKTTISKLGIEAAAKKIPLFATMENLDKNLFSEKITASSQKFLNRMRQFKEFSQNNPVSDILKKIINDTEYVKNLEAEKTEESLSRVENIKELLSVAAEFESSSQENNLETFLMHMSLVTDQDAPDKLKSFVTLITLHAVKGLEFRTVFIAGMEEGLFPHFRSMLEPATLEEERRLCYVGLTRAKEMLFIVSAKMRRIFGEERYSQQSRFIEEIPQDLLEIISSDIDTAESEIKKISIR